MRELKVDRVVFDEDRSVLHLHLPNGNVVETTADRKNTVAAIVRGNLLQESRNG